MAHEEAFLIVVGVDEPACDATRVVAAQIGVRVGLQYSDRSQKTDEPLSRSLPLTPAHSSGALSKKPPGAPAPPRASRRIGFGTPTPRPPEPRPPEPCQAATLNRSYPVTRTHAELQRRKT